MLNTGFPEVLRAPSFSGPVRLLQGDEYAQALALKNAVNRSLRTADPAAYKGLDIHEIQPVKFGGDPVSILNKVAISPESHGQISAFYRSIQYYLEGK